MTEASDCLTLKALDPKHLQFSFELYFTNYHSCTMNGVAERGSDGTWTYREKSEDVDCTLQLTIDDARIGLADVDGGCRMYYCGARAFIDGAEFSREAHTSELSECGVVP